MELPEVYLDTNVFKFSATQLPRLKPRVQTINWGDIEQDVTVHDFVEVNPNEGISNPELSAEAEVLPKLAELGKKGFVRYLIQAETLFESWGIPNLDSKSGPFYGAPIEHVEAPVQYERVMIGGHQDPKEMQFDFLSRLRNKRFKQLQKITGAYQGPGKLNRNQLLDAFHIWCAEHNDCEFFLTLDFRLIKVVDTGGADRVEVNLVRPSELIKQLENRT